MKLSTKDFFSKCDQIPNFLRIWSNLLKKSLIENFIFCAVIGKSKKKKLTPNSCQLKIYMLRYKYLSNPPGKLRKVSTGKIFWGCRKVTFQNNKQLFWNKYR